MKAPNTVKVFVRGLEFYGFHGVSEAEREIGHRYVLDVEITAKVNATETDKIDDTIDYGVLAMKLLERGGGLPCLTVERLGTEMAEIIFDAYPSAENIRLVIAKKLPPAPVIAELAGVEMHFTRC